MPGFRHLDELVSLVLRHLGDGHIILRKRKPGTSGDTDLDDYEFPEDDEEDEAK